MVVSEPQLQNFLAQVRASGVFGRSARREALLEHLLRAELQGDGDALKAYSIGLDVMGRREDFDPSTDSIVRVEVGRLREALTQFYETDYAQSQIKVNIPKGSYRPVIEQPDQAIAPSQITMRKGPIYGIIGAIVAVIIGLIIWDYFSTPPLQDAQANSITLSFNTVSSSANLDSADAETLTSFSIGLRRALSKRRTFTLLSEPYDNIGVKPDYEIIIRAIGQPTPHRISLELIDAKDKTIQWAEAYPITETVTQGNLDGLVSRAADDLFPQIVSSSKEALNMRPLDSLNPWELYLLSTWVPGTAISNLEWEVQRRDMAQKAITLDPTLGQAHSVLADKLSYLSSVDSHFYSPEVAKQARAHANKALAFAPRDANTLFNLSIYNWHMGQNGDAVALLERIQAIDQFNGFAGFLASVFPYTCMPPPDDVLAAAYAFDRQLNSDNPIRWVTLTWLGMLHLNRGEFHEALKAEAKAHVIFHTPDTVVRHAVVMHATGNTQAAIRLINAERPNWPNLDPAHFSDVTMPRRCGEASDPTPLLTHYEQFERAYATDAFRNAQ